MSTEPSKSVGLVGCGLAGSAITERLFHAGFRVYSFDLTDSRVQPMVRLGAICLDSPTAVAQATKRIIISSAGEKDAEHILWGARGLLTATKRPAYIIDIDAIDPQRVTTFAARAEAGGCELIDATITGTYKTIGHGQGGLIVGGSAGAIQACSNIFDALSERWTHVGGSGTAAHGRILLTTLISLHRSALAEALVCAEAFGINPSVFADLVRMSPAYSAAGDSKRQQMLQHEFAPQRRMLADQRDIEAATRNAASIGQGLPVAELQSWLIADAVAAGAGNLDIAAIIETIRQRRTSKIGAEDTGLPRQAEPGHEKQATEPAP